MIDNTLHTKVRTALEKLIEVHKKMEEHTDIVVWLNPNMQPHEPVRLVEILPEMRDTPAFGPDEPPAFSFRPSDDFPYELWLCLGNRTTVETLLATNSGFRREYDKGEILWRDSKSNKIV